MQITLSINNPEYTALNGSSKAQEFYRKDGKIIRPGELGGGEENCEMLTSE